jgi:hypothetical protein
VESVIVVQARANLEEVVRHQTSKPVSGAAVMRSKIGSFRMIVQNTEISAEARSEYFRVLDTLERMSHARDPVDPRLAPAHLPVTEHL